MNITDIAIDDNAQIIVPGGVRVSVAVIVTARGHHTCVFTGPRENAVLEVKAHGASQFTAARAVMRSHGVPRKTANSMLRSAVSAMTTRA